jgi:hypothetical protein
MLEDPPTEVRRIWGLQSWRRRESEFILRILLMIELKSMSLASFLRSSFGLPRNAYVWPSLPWMVILRGFASDFMTSTSSENPAILRFLVNMNRGKEGKIFTMEGWNIWAEWLVEGVRCCGRRGKNNCQRLLQRHNQWGWHKP